MSEQLTRSSIWPRQLWRGLLLAAGLLLISLATAADEHRVLVVKSSDAPIYDRVVDALMTRLKEVCAPDCRASDLSVITRLDMIEGMPATDLAIPIGRLAGLSVAESMPDAAIYGLIPKTTWDEITDCCPAVRHPQATALFLNQPIARQLNMIRVILPAASRIAVLYGENSVLLRDRVSAEAGRLGFDVVARLISDDSAVGPALDTMLDDVDALLALPDPGVYNRDTIYGVLLTTYRKGVPVFGYAKSLVDAGAIAAVYSSPEDVGRQLAEMAADYLMGNQPLPAPSMPRLFSVAVNKRVMRSLGLQSLSEDEVHRRLLEFEQ